MIRLLEFHRSGNCAKVRVALGYKGISFSAEEMSHADRSPMQELVNWPMVPVIVDGDVRMRDSEAILHYLESNYRDRPSLTPATREEIQRGEELRDEVQHRVRPILRRVYREVLKDPAARDPGVTGAAVAELAAALQPLERILARQPFVLGERMTLYDVLLACALTPARPPAEYAAQSPMWAFFQERFTLPRDLPAVAEWIDRVMAHDTDGSSRESAPSEATAAATVAGS